ncbi:family 78 glycoside hydrolase catalytic domain (plasmid) [Coraliomargarita sp. W4R53]
MSTHLSHARREPREPQSDRESTYAVDTVNLWRLERLRTQALTEPIGLQTATPSFGYHVQSQLFDQEQSAYQIMVSSSPELLDAAVGDLWDSGIVRESANSDILYCGQPLSSRQQAFWKVRAWDAAGTASAWSDVATFEMGLLQASDWSGTWVGQGDDFDGNRSAVPLFAKDFAIRSSTAVASARLYISGLGVFEARLNGAKVSDHFFEAGESDNRKTVNYATYDLTEQLVGGENSLGVMLGNAFYGMYDEVENVIDGVARYVKWDGIQTAPKWEDGLYGRIKFLAQLEVVYEDGSRDVITSDDTWRFTEGPITFSNWLSGEDFDARRVAPGWDEPGHSRTGWRDARPMQAPPGVLASRECAPIRIFDAYPAVRVTRLDAERLLVDMGRNGAGLPELSLMAGPELAGATIRVYPAEVLNEDGSVNQSSVMGEFDYGEMFSTYTVGGTGQENWRPTFTYYGYRYLELRVSSELSEWQPAPTHFTNHLLRTDNETVGTFTTSNADLDAINMIITRSIESNMFSTLTDCPHIEKAGWLECTHLLHDSIAPTFDIQSWVRKLLRDIADAQYDTGEAAPISPPFQHVNFLSRDPNWGGALIFTPYAQYQEYGDLSAARKLYPQMVRYIDFLARQCDGNGLLLNYAQMGEWGGYDASTTKDFTASATFHRMLLIMQEICLLTRHANDAGRFALMAQRLRTSIHQRFFDPTTGVYDSGSQSSYALALFNGLVDDDHITQTVEGLVNRIASDGYHLTSGEVGLKQVFSVLAQHAQNEVVYKMITNETMPSYLYFVRNGMTTLPEYWDMSRSLNHAMMGHAKAWMHRSLAGLAPTSPGYSSVEIAPFIPIDVSWVQGAQMTVAGKFATRWAVGEDRRTLELDFLLPVGTRARLRVPRLEATGIELDGKPYPATVVNDCFVIESVGSGAHRIVTTTVDTQL